jgi:3-hydroxyacyl-CoA dehydrogenase/enoyl-CoA hydratase/3-hydroxybutyryl-CoA epimerase
VRYSRDDHGHATLTLDMPGKSVNTLSRQMWAELDAAIAQAANDKPQSLSIVSAKPKVFIAGADLFELRAMNDSELDQYLADGQRILDRLEKLPFPTIAVIAGDALGGGLEVALACQYRIAADEPGIKLGLPEVQLGICPGWGGTVRTTLLLGAEKAIQLATTGKPVAPADALKMGLIDAVAPRAELLKKAQELFSQSSIVNRYSKPADVASIINSIQTAEKKLENKNLPAPARIVQVIRATAEGGAEAGLAAERRGLIELRATLAGRNLLRLFFLRQSAKKDAATSAGGTAKEVKRVAVIGGGMMGGGIVHAFVKSKIPVVCIESEQVAPLAASRIKSALEKDGLATDSFRVSSNIADVKDAELVIEAIVEDLAAKDSLFKQLDNLSKPTAILATNTSSLSVGKISNALADPCRMVGIHFFNPVPKMPLVEIIRHPCATAESVATAVAVATQLGKTPIVCNDAPGFIVNRILMPYLSESMRLAEEGVSIESIDAAVKNWGMPMGPFELLDQIGLDVIVGIFKALRPHLGDRVEIPSPVMTALERKWLGRKTKIGFYQYSDDRSARPQANAEMVSWLSKATATLDAPSIQDRCLLPMANEAARVLEESVTDSIDAIDLACITGLGMAGWRGGICRYVLDTGVSIIAAKLQALAAKHGDRLNPSKFLWQIPKLEKPV